MFCAVFGLYWWFLMILKELKSRTGLLVPGTFRCVCSIAASYLHLHLKRTLIISWLLAFGIYRVGCKDIPHDHVVCFLIMYAFWPCGILYKTTENFDLGYLTVRNDINVFLSCAWDHTAHVGSPSESHLYCGLALYCCAPNLWSMVPNTTQSFGFLLIPITFWEVRQLL